jgi:multidrug efflux system outer membrane protein
MFKFIHHLSQKRLIYSAIALAVCAMNSDKPAIAKEKASVVTPAVVQTGSRWEEFRTPLLNRGLAINLSTEFPDREWWRGFHDPYLEKYIDAALQNNPTLNIALSRIEEAHAQMRESVAQQIPKANLSGAYYHLGLPQSMGTSLPKRLNIWTVPFQASYEVDLFGRLRDQSRAGKQFWEASKQDARAAQISLCGDVANAYFNLLRNDALVNSQRQNLALLTRIYELKQSQYKIGLNSYDETIRADRDVSLAQTNLNEYQQQQAIFAHQLAILTGSPPTKQESLTRGAADSIQPPLQISAGTPAESLARRPDIQAAEKRLESVHYSVSAARKALLPTLKLNAGMFLAGMGFSQVFNWGNRANLISAAVSQPLTDLVGKKAELNVQKSRQRQQLEDYRRVTLNALKEVEDSLALINSNFQTLDSNQKRRELTQHELGLNQNLYQQGLLPHVNVLQGQSELIQYDQMVAQSKIDTILATVNLYKALGGGY